MIEWRCQVPDNVNRKLPRTRLLCSRFKSQRVCLCLLGFGEFDEGSDGS